MARPLIVFVDVDDTLVRSYGSKRIPMPGTIKVVRQLHAEGVELYCWSSGGALYAQESAAEFGLSDCFVGFLPKPNVLIDDVSIDSWQDFKQLHPNQAASSDRSDLERVLGRRWDE